MSTPKQDLLGRPLGDLEKQVAAIHESLVTLLHRDDLAPCLVANAKHALAATWQMMNALDLEAPGPEDLAEHV